LDTSTRKWVKVPKGHVWLQGDNLANSIDSRNYGAVPEATLKGRVLARVSAEFDIRLMERFPFATSHSSPVYQIPLWMPLKMKFLDSRERKPSITPLRFIPTVLLYTLLRYLGALPS